jgi:hypothetical protein
VELSGKLCKIKDFEEKTYRKSVVLRNIDSVFPDNCAKMLSHNLYLPKAQGKWIKNWRNWE